MAHELIQVIASCGVHADVPPSTLAAFEAAIRAGCDMTETDFRRCRDGVIVFHEHQAGGRPVASLTRRETREAAGVLPELLRAADAVLAAPAADASV